MNEPIKCGHDYLICGPVIKGVQQCYGCGYFLVVDVNQDLKILSVHKENPNMSKAVTEQELAEKAVAPRVTKDQIDALMDRVAYVTVQQPGDTTSTFVHAFLDGKFFLATGFSACVNAENFNADIGERLARSNAEKHAENKLWELEGYRLYSAS